MWWFEHRAKPLTRLAVVLAAGLLAGCFEPLYGRNPLGDESVRDRLAEVVVAPIPLRQGTPQARVAVAMRNALQFDLNNGGAAIAPTHRLEVTVTPTDVTVSIDPVTGRPQEEIGGVNANLSAGRDRNRQDRAQGFHLRACRLRYSGIAAALRQAARFALFGRSRRENGGRGDPQPARVLFRRRHLNISVSRTGVVQKRVYARERAIAGAPLIRDRANPD